MSVVFAPDGRTLATSSDDHTVILWDLADRTRPARLGAPLTDHTNSVMSVVSAPDGRTLAAASWAGPVILWDLTSLNDLLDIVVERACSIAVGGFDQDEWKRRIPEAPYQDTCPSGGG